jgi:hypothetical protein
MTRRLRLTLLGVGIVVVTASLVAVAVMIREQLARTDPAFTHPDSSSFTRPGRQWSGFLFFSTETGISCRIVSYVMCEGNIPGLPTTDTDDGYAGRGACALATKLTHSTSPDPYSLFRRGGQCPPFAETVLKPGQSLSIRSASCRVDHGDVVACTDFQGHGFVLQPSGSRAF